MSHSIFDKIKKGDSNLPPRVLLSGPEGIGKSTWASHAPKPLFISSEDGLTGLNHVDRITPANLTELHALLDAIIKDGCEFKTLVVDTADWLERMIYASICKRDGKSDIEDYGYGKGYVIAENELVGIIAKLDAIRATRRMGIIILSHVQIKRFAEPGGSEWDRYEMKGNKRMTGILREWPDACLFAVFEVHQTKEKGKSREKTIGGDRVVRTVWSPGWDAKNRYRLPETLPLDYAAFSDAVKAAVDSTPALKEQVKAAFEAATLDATSRRAWQNFINTLDSRSVDELTTALERLQTKKGE